MTWFEEQIKARRENDENALHDAYSEAINAIVGESFSFDAAEDAVTRILRYYRLPPVKLPVEIEDENEKLTAVCRLSGLMQRPVKLEAGWYRNAFGAFLVRLKDGEEWVAVLPDHMGRYSFFDPKSRSRVYLSRKSAALLEGEGVCFYKPLPARTITVVDLVKFGVSSWSGSDFLFTYLMLFFSTMVGLLTPKLSYVLYSVVPVSGSVSLLLSTVVFLTCVNLANLCLNGMQSLFSARVGVKMSAALHSAAMMRTLSLPPRFFREYSGGEVVSRMGYMESIGSGIVTMLFSTSASSLFSLAYITQIFRFAPALVWPSLAVILANVLFSVYTTWRQMGIAKRRMEMSAKNNALSIEMVSGIQKIRMAGAEKRMFARYAKSYAEECKATYNPPLFIKYHTAFSLIISLAGQWVIYWVTLGARVDVAQYYAFQTSYAMISAAISSLVGIALQAASMKPGLEMLRPMLDTVPENEGNAQEVTSLSGNIEISHVSFRYEENMPDVICDLSLKIHAGQYVAIVGRTGCGKSTLFRLLLGFETPRLGAIYYDGRDITRLEKRSLRQKIGTVMQDDQLFPGDIYSNIVICAPSLPLKRAWEAAEIAGIADDIRAMPMGMHTVVGESAGGISGGQRQRLVIARAVAPRPKLLLFDEATSALDNVTQKKVSQALDGLRCTRIVIAHRLSTIRHCDRILVMDKGQIIEDGTYEELLAKNGEFARLVERQRVDL